MQSWREFEETGSIDGVDFGYSDVVCVIGRKLLRGLKSRLWVNEQKITVLEGRT